VGERVRELWMVRMAYDLIVQPQRAIVMKHTHAKKSRSKVRRFRS